MRSFKTIGINKKPTAGKRKNTTLSPLIFPYLNASVGHDIIAFDVVMMEKGAGNMFPDRILRINDLKIDRTYYETQYDAKRLAGSKFIVMDVVAGDTAGRKFDMEVENWDAEPERAEYHVSTMCIENLHVGDSFSQLPELYVIFITGKDVIGDGRPIHHFRYIDDMDYENNAQSIQASPISLNGKTHIIYANGAYINNGSAIGKLMHDFRCRDAGEMFYKNMAERANYLKNNSKGVKEMCKIMEEMREETEQIVLLRDIQNVMDSFGVGVERAMESLKIPFEQQGKFADIINANIPK